MSQSNIPAISHFINGLAVAVGHIADTLVEKLIPRVKQLVVKNGMEPDAEIGLLAGQYRQGC
jgi:malonate-semialdehyde dehydrogenase (acetylating)/methylmalonate-semialdehyde dehydrogenase